MRQRVEAVEKKKQWDLIICQEGHTQVAAAAADLTTQLFLGTRGHRRIFNWVQSSTSYTDSCLRESVAVDLWGLTPKTLVFEGSELLLTKMNLLICYKCICRASDWLNYSAVCNSIFEKLIHAKMQTNQLVLLSLVAGCHDKSQPILPQEDWLSPAAGFSTQTWGQSLSPHEQSWYCFGLWMCQWYYVSFQGSRPEDWI